MKSMFLLSPAIVLFTCSISAEESLDAIKVEIQELKRRVAALEEDNGSGGHLYAIVAVGAQGRRSAVSHAAKAGGLARLRWDSDAGDV
jgi:hypothetical protein